jgi:hypothetical protein
MYRDQVLLFLSELKRLLKEEQFLVLENRVENRAHMARLGFRKADIIDTIWGLKVTDCISAPRDDDKPNRIGTICEFVVLIDSIETYIKPEIETMSQGRRGVCISFHSPNKPYRFSFS